ncbi:MAG: CinA family protein [Thermomicrobiales bacterium]|nr:CinA family protein [Thermomicrobiales bacterium]
MANDPLPTTQPTPEDRLFALLGERGQLQVATAESCTGGNVAARLTSIAGSSAYVQGGLVTYSNDAKANLLGVSREMLASVGAVSPECAIAMAEGARRAYHADLAVSTTGIAGPSGATARKPVGLVYIAIADGAETRVESHTFPGDRAAITRAATDRALELLVEGVERALAASLAG